MRDIKFRAIAINSKDMIYSMTIANGTIKRKKDNYYFEVSPNRWIGVISETIGQYTGLKDKNGKENYEGDIINDQDLIFEIVFQDGCFCKKNEVGVWILYENKFEIIGNIHENKNLLK